MWITSGFLNKINDLPCGYNQFFSRLKYLRLFQLLTVHMAHVPLKERDPKKVIEAKKIIDKMLKV